MNKSKIISTDIEHVEGGIVVTNKIFIPDKKDYDHANKHLCTHKKDGMFALMKKDDKVFCPICGESFNLLEIDTECNITSKDSDIAMVKDILQSIKTMWINASKKDIIQVGNLLWKKAYFDDDIPIIKELWKTANDNFKEYTNPLLLNINTPYPYANALAKAPMLNPYID